MNGAPPTSTRGFGRVAVRSPRRVPAPPARISASRTARPPRERTASVLQYVPLLDARSGGHRTLMWTSAASPILPPSLPVIAMTVSPRSRATSTARKDVGAIAARRDRHKHVTGPPVRGYLARKDLVESVVVPDGRERRCVRRQGDAATHRAPAGSVRPTQPPGVGRPRPEPPLPQNNSVPPARRQAAQVLAASMIARALPSR